MKITQYMQLEKTISAAEVGGIRQRWLYGLRLLRDPEVMSSGGGGLRHGVMEQLVAGATARGFKLSATGIRRRILCARTYPTEAQISSATADFRTWTDLRSANFPAYPAPADEPPADHRNQPEKDHDAARRLLDMVGEQGALFPLAMFDPVDAPLKDLVEYAGEMEALTQRFVRRDTERRAYLEELAAAVGGDLTSVWGDAHHAAFGNREVTDHV